MPVTLDLTGLVLPDTVEEQSRSKDGRRAQFLLQPLERGFGHTIGNSIRRILLSSLPGAAAWAFRADGVQHQHQSIEGVAEDVHQIIQNLKRLVVILDPGVEEARLELSVHEAGTVTASDISKRSGVNMVEPQHALFTLQEDLPEGRPFRMDVWVKRGRGFVMADQHEVPHDVPVDQIRIDSLFNPVVKANFTVQETRVGQRTDFDRLTLDITTNGAMDPKDAVRHAAEIARLHLAYLSQFSERPDALMAVQDGDGAQPEAMGPILGDAMRELLERPLEAFKGISARTRNTLEKQGIERMADIVARTRDDMLKIQSFGERSLEEVAEVLGEHNLRFGMPVKRDDDGNLYLAEELSGNGVVAEATAEAAGEDDEA